MNLRRTVSKTCAATLLVVLSIATPWISANSHTDSFSFALIGDQPYNNFFEPATSQLIQQIGRERHVSWILHIGDIKGGNEPCSDDLLERRLDQLQQSEKPLVYVPGDNEWTDCHRSSNGNFDTQERLEFLRKQAFSKPRTLGKQGFPIRQQIKHPYPEHLMWTQGSTLFLSLNIPGSNNDLLNPKSRNASTKKVKQLFEARSLAIESWLAEAEQLFDKADPRLTETVIAIQGNPIDGSGGAGSNPVKNGYARFMKSLVKYINTTKRPVLLAHGDTHRFKWDKPSLKRFGGTPETDALFYRVEGWGHPFMNAWVQVTVTPGTKMPFEASSISLPAPEVSN
ncbi:hypothetical protein [Limnobacter sp.]|uniref:hypothetical protein n=1 Tax=Limnobacter sp. TaxID=2003368 RepID=UPI003747E0EC